MTHLLTLGDVARRLGVPRARLDYALDKAGIHERDRVGILRLYSPDQVPVIQAALTTVRTRTTQPVASGGDGDGEHVNS